jgi:hypothetical protein
MKKIQLSICCGISRKHADVAGYRLTEHFGIWRRRFHRDWSLTHLPSGMAAGFGSRAECAELAAELERVRLDWSIATVHGLATARGWKAAGKVIAAWRKRHGRELVRVT